MSGISNDIKQKKFKQLETLVTFKGHMWVTCDGVVFDRGGEWNISIVRGFFLKITATFNLKQQRNAKYNQKLTSI